jgi:hypothetical protein
MATKKKDAIDSNTDIIKARVNQLESNLNEYVDGIKEIDPNTIPDELKIVLEQMRSDVMHFIDNYWMTIGSIKPGTKPPGEQKKIKEREFIYNLVISYRKEKGNTKYPTFKHYLRALNFENERRKDNGDISLGQVSDGTYITIKKEILGN